MRASEGRQGSAGSLSFRPSWQRLLWPSLDRQRLHPMAYHGPEVEVTSVAMNGNITTVTLQFLRDPDSPPIAPGALYRPPDLSHWLFELHRLAERKGLFLTFETYAATLAPPQVGERYAFRSWWTKAAAEAVLDRAAEWVERTYPADHQHEHCLITWEAIYPGQVGCFSDRHGWITTNAYREFIKSDLYRVRASERDWRDC
jgi:hypothetical protein